VTFSSDVAKLGRRDRSCPLAVTGFRRAAARRICDTYGWDVDGGRMGHGKREARRL